MTDLLQRSSAWLDAQRRTYASRLVVYQHGSQTVEVPATIGRTVFEIENDYGVLERTESRDFLISVADLVLGGNRLLPTRGDRVQETQDGTVFVYEVVAPGKEPCWRYSDPYRQTLRIHTKQVQ